MKTDTIFREIDSLISFAEAKQGDLSASAVRKLKTFENKLTSFRSDNIQNWVEGKSASFFQLARTVNRKVEQLSESYAEFVKPVSYGSYLPIGIDIDDI